MGVVRARILALGFLAVAATCAETNDAAAAHVMTPPEFQSLPSKAADRRIPYGDDKQQFGDLRVPAGKGPHPVVILIHGGCWRADFATLKDLAPIADALKESGVATWSIEYRRLSQPGGGWPGTYLDVAHGIDHLRELARPNSLDLNRVVVVGHSAGGHLALWAAARTRLPKESPLYAAQPLPLRGVVDLAGVGDLQAFIPFEQEGCGAPVVEQLMGGTPAAVPERYRQASPMTMLPLGVPQILVWGDRDSMVRMSLGESYARAAKAAGDRVELLTFPGIGHFEIADPSSAAWRSVQREIVRLQTSK